MFTYDTEHIYAVYGLLAYTIMKPKRPKRMKLFSILPRQLPKTRGHFEWHEWCNAIPSWTTNQIAEKACTIHLTVKYYSDESIILYDTWWNSCTTVSIFWSTILTCVTLLPSALPCVMAKLSMMPIFVLHLEGGDISNCVDVHDSWLTESYRR